jgi:hypothetical protein
MGFNSAFKGLILRNESKALHHPLLQSLGSKAERHWASQ